MIVTDPTKRKGLPVATGFTDYFPDAMVAVAEVSRKGNDQHNPGKPLFWDRSKSGDEADALMRHFLDRGKLDSDGMRHSAKMAWRAMALLQKELENEKVQPVTADQYSAAQIAGHTERTDTEIQERKKQLIDRSDTSDARRSVLIFLWTPQETELQYQNADTNVRYSAVLESQWLYGFRSKPWADERGAP
jgi:hypothetical protein